MEVILIRYSDTPVGTRGKVLFRENGKLTDPKIHTIEKRWVNNQPRISCIPTGTYDMVLEYSPAFKMDLWEIKGVPNRSETKFHAANRESQLKGCIAPGLVISPTGVGKSKAALDIMHKILENKKNVKLIIL